MKSILISGITGFVGVNLKNYLASKYVIKGLSRKAQSNNEILCYDDFRAKHLEDAQAFIHLAGKAHDLKKTSEDKAYYEANTELTKNLYDQFLKSNCEVFIFMSSVKAAADSVDVILTEGVTPNPQTVYGKSKLAAENYILSKNIPENKSVYILRPCMIHGPNNKGNLNLLYSIINKGIPYPLGKYKNKRSFLSVDNLSFCIDNLIYKRPKSGIYNVADNKAISTTALVTVIGNSLGKKAKIINVPKPLIELIAKIGDIIPIPINTERLNKLTENYQVSNDKIKKAISQELPMSTTQGIEKTVNSFNA